jgi:hypothetical protein
MLKAVVCGVALCWGVLADVACVLLGFQVVGVSQGSQEGCSTS